MIYYRLLLFYSLIQCSLSAATGYSNNNNHHYNNNNETSTDRSLLRTMTIIEQRTEAGRLILLICGKRKICQRSRSEVPQWIREFNEKNHYNGYELIHYHFYVMGPKLPILNEKPITFPALVYIIAKTPHMFYGNVTDRTSVDNWMAEMDRLKIQEPNTNDEIDKILADVDVENCTSKYLMLINDDSKCHFPTWPVIARHLSNRHGIVPIQLNPPIPPEINVVLRRRMPEFIYSGCRNLVMITQNSFGIPPDVAEPEVMSEWVETHFPQRDNCFSLDSSVWLPVRPKLSELELIFFSGEQNLGALEHKWSYIWVGVVGGCAVCTLAFSIFWGLNGSAFAK